MLRRNSSAAVVQASTILEAKAIDACCHPVDLEKADCNCSNFSPSMKCLVSFFRVENAVESAPEPPDIGTLTVQDDDACGSNEEGDLDCESDDDLHAENFKVKGSFFQEHYQQALAKCDNAKRQNQAISARVEFEPDNIQDKNAIKFEVYFNNEWHIIGYCDVRKIPKLRKAMNSSEIKTVSLLYVKREWITWQSKFSFYACISIVKRRQWGKDDHSNHYNSNIEI